MSRIALLCVCLTSLPLLAQTGTAQESAPTSTDTAEIAAPAAAPVSTEDRFVEAEGRLGIVDEKLSELSNDVGLFKKLKVGGYIQGRYTDVQNSGRGLDTKGAPLVKDGFNVRRGRLKATYSGTWSAAVLQIDATPKGVSLKDAEAHLIEPWTGKKLTLVVGQTKWPFGYEVLQSSSEREFPERTRVVRAFAAGERDRGAKLLAKVGALRFAGGVFDGTGIENKTFPGVDGDHRKDGIARLGFDIHWLSGGVSGWWGQARDPVVLDYRVRRRVGADLQLYLDLLPVGATALKGEFIRGRSYFKDGVEQLGALGHGWYGLLVQNIGLSNSIAFRYDYFDPATGTADGESGGKLLGTNAIGTAGVTVMHEWDESLRVSATYEVPVTGAPSGIDDPKDSIFTLQLQAKY